MALLEVIFLLYMYGASALERECTGKGYFADPRNCRKYYYCIGGDYSPVLMSCPAATYFDSIKKKCVEKNKDLTCGSISETVAERHELWRPLDTRERCRPPWELPQAYYDSDLELGDDIKAKADPFPAKRCDANCIIPECFCSVSGVKIPFNLRPTEVPQFILLMFNGPVNKENVGFYSSLFKGRDNPDRCNIRATFFISHENTSYHDVHKLEAARHEIAMLSVSQNSATDYWKEASFDTWTDEILGMRSIIHKYARIRHHELSGVRAPFTHMGASDTMLHVLYHFGLKYDSSIVASPREVPVWPYTLDYKISHSCTTGNCPLYSYPGLWEVPLNTLYREFKPVKPCVQLDQCDFPDEDRSSAILEFLKSNFMRHYHTNRAPLTLSFSEKWVTKPEQFNALNDFILHLLEEYPSVYFVTVSQAIAWIHKPTITRGMNTFSLWSCEYCVPSCSLATCSLNFHKDLKNPVRTMEVCKKCPKSYPWLGNYDGLNEGKAYTLDGAYYTF